MRRPKYRLSPNEVERLVKEDQEQRRKLRIIQVREQSKASAAVIRSDVRREKERLLDIFAAEVKEKLQAEKEENIRKLEQKYENTLRAIGEGHKEALIHGDGQNRAEKLQKQMEEEAAAQERFKQALERQRKEGSVKEFEKTKHILARQAALLTEKQRAVEIASLPPPPPDICVELEQTKKRAVPMVDMQAFATTHYHIPDYHVVRADSQEQLYDAKSLAQDSDLRLKQDLEEKARSKHEQLARAQIRGNEALQKELLKHDYEDMLKDLSLLQKKDRRLRKKMLSQIPKQVFIPPEIYLEEKKEKQNEMERQFTEIYMDHLKMERDKQRQSDLPDQIVSHEFEDVSSPPTATAAEDFSISMSRINPALRDLTNLSQPVTDSEVKKPDTVLKQLLNRIKEQRDDPGTSQNIPSASEAKRRPASGEDNQNVSAAGGKAVWMTTRDDSPGLEPVAAGHTRKSRDPRLPVGETNHQPGTDFIAMSDNEKMIEDLRRRIELIESQKEKLSQHLKAQVGFHGPLAADTEGSTLEGDEEGWTLEEVDIDAVTGIDGNMQKNEQANILPVDGADVDQGTAWKPPLGSGQRTAFGSYLRTNVDSDFISGARRDTGVQQQVTGVPVEKVNSNIGPAKSTWKPPLGIWGIPGDLRTDMGSDFISGARSTEVQQEGSLLRGCGMSEVVKFGGAGGIGSAGGVLPLVGDARQIWQHPTSFDRLAMSSLGYGTMSSLPDDSTGQDPMGFVRQDQGENNFSQSVKLVNDSADLMRKVKEYRERAVERQAGMDAETLSKVREYQYQLLQTYDEKKKYLADIRADIEKRQQELSAAASSKSAFSLESIQVKQSVMDMFEYPTGNSQPFSAGQVVVSGTGESNVGRSSHGRRSDQVHVTSKESVVPSLSAPNVVVKHMLGDKSDGDEVSHQVRSKHVVAGQLQEMIIKPACHSSGGEKNNIDKVRKSLSFDDAEESMNAGPDSWKDVATDADNSKCSQALTDDSRLMSSEEERGSPVLPQGHFEMSEKSNTSLPGRTYLNGSSLLAQAQEKKLGFEHRQMELQNQLVDIQRQKDAIMQAYYTGQSALQQRQRMLMSKMATTSALLNEDSSGKQREEVRAKLANIRSEIDTDARSRVIAQESRPGNTSIDFDNGKESRSYSAFSNSNFNVPLHPAENLNESTDIDRTSSRQSLGNCSMPGNTSSDSYLAEISFHKIRSDDGRSLPSSAFHVPVPSSASFIPVSRSLTSNQQQQSQTWASILSTSANFQQRSLGLHQQNAQGVGLVNQNEVTISSLSNTGCPEQLRTLVNYKEAYQNTRSPAADVVDSGNNDVDDHRSSQYTSSLMSTAFGITDHQPHELSTILEVDTPSSTSAVTSARKLATLSEPSAATSHTINSMSFQGGNLPVSRVNSGVQVDVFAELPYTFQENRATGSLGPSGAVYNLQSGHKYDDPAGDRSGPGLRMECSIPGDQKQTKAKRSLDFSENSCVSTNPAFVELAQYRASDIQELSTRGLVHDNINIDRALGQNDSGGEDSSLKISGFSEYLRLQERSGGKVDDECGGISALSTNISDIDAEGNVGSFATSDDKAADRPEVLSLMPHGHSFDPNIVEQLQQRSRAVFSGVVVGESSNEVSVLSLSYSSVSCDLEEVSIPEAGN